MMASYSRTDLLQVTQTAYDASPDALVAALAALAARTGPGATGLGEDDRVEIVGRMATFADARAVELAEAGRVAAALKRSDNVAGSVPQEQRGRLRSGAVRALALRCLAQAVCAPTREGQVAVGTRADATLTAAVVALGDSAVPREAAVALSNVLLLLAAAFPGPDPHPTPPRPTHDPSADLGSCCAQPRPSAASGSTPPSP